MSTKLKKPITVTFTHVENAVEMAILSNCNYRTSNHRNFNTIKANHARGECHDQIESALKEQGIDWNTWLPPQPFKIAGRECEFKPDGTVKLSCGTVISNDEIDAFLKRRQEAGVGGWPKYFVTKWGNLFRADYESDFGHYWSDGVWNKHNVGPSVVEFCTGHDWKQISIAEALKITGEIAK